MKELAVVIPVMNEEDNIQPLLESVRNALDGIDYEVILVDDGSIDATKKRIIDHADERIKLVELKKNYGQSTAMTAGIDHANSKYIAMIDGDLQNDPSEPPGMVFYIYLCDFCSLQFGEHRNKTMQFAIQTKIFSDISLKYF